MNTAVALAQLGRDVQFLGRLGNDSFARQLREHISRRGVGLDLAVDVEQPTSLAVVSLAEDGSATYQFHFDQTANFSWQPEDFPTLGYDDWLHFGSLAAVLGEGASALVDFVAQTSATLSYDINVRMGMFEDMEHYLAAVMPIVEAVGASGGIIKASDEDLRLLADDPELDPDEMAQEWLDDCGASMFLLTKGGQGATAVLRGDRRVEVPGRKVVVADTIGAGDTFMAGFLDHYVDHPDDVEGALHQAVAAAAFVCEREGAQPPSQRDLAAYLG